MRVVGGYRLAEELGRGGMGVVYRAHTPHGEPCALKLLLDLDDDEGLERFQREAHGAKRLQHPHLIRVVDYGVSEGHPYLVMPFLEGQNLRDRLRSGPLPIAEAVEIVAALADGLAHAHAMGVLHRDLKPENVVMTPAGAVLTDFGLAKPLLDRQSLTQTGQLVGTPAYMAPEQARGDKAQIGVATDVYGLGALLYALLVGSAPFRGATALAILTKVLDDRPQAPSSLREGVSSTLDACVLRCLAKEPGQRFGDMVELRDALRSLGSVEEATPSDGGGQARLLIGVTLSAVLLLALVAAWALREPQSELPVTPSAGLAAGTPNASHPDRPAATPKPTRPRQSGRYSRNALRRRLGVPAGVNAVDHVYHQVVVGLSSPRETGLRWEDEGAARSKDPELRLAWALALTQGLDRPAEAALICSEVLAELGPTPRLRIVRAFAHFSTAKPAWLRSELGHASSSKDAPRYAIGLYALTLQSEGKIREAIRVAEEGIQRGDPGSAAALAQIHRSRVGEGNADYSPELVAYAELEPLCEKLFGRVPVSWAIGHAQVLFLSKNYAEGRKRFRAAVRDGTWTARPSIAFVKALKDYRAAKRDPSEKEGATREIKELLRRAGPRTTNVNEAIELLALCEEHALPLQPTLYTLSGLTLSPFERGRRAELLLAHLNALEHRYWSGILGGLNQALQKGGPPSRLRRMGLLLGRVRIRSRLLSEAERRDPDAADLTEAEALGAGHPWRHAQLAWIEFERGGLGLHATLRHADLALAQQAQYQPRLVALRAEAEYYLAKKSEAERDRRILAGIKPQDHPQEAARAAKALRYLRGIRQALAANYDKARVEFEILSEDHQFYRWRDARRWLAFSLAGLGKTLHAEGILSDQTVHESPLSRTLSVLARASGLEARKRDRAAIEGILGACPPDSYFHAVARELLEEKR